MRHRREGRHTDCLRIDAERQLRHGGVARERHLVHLRRIDSALLAHLADQLLQRLARERAEALERLRVEHRRGDPGDHVGAEGLLLVQHRTHRHRRAGRDVEQSGNDGRGAQVERDRVRDTRRITGLDVDQEVVGDNARDLPVRLAQDLREGTQHVDLDT